MAYPSVNDGRNGYYAVCLDLSLFTWRPTKKEARRSLNDAIRGYLEVVADLATPEEAKNWQRTILRPMPIWPFEIRYYLYRFLAKLPKPSNTQKSGRAQVFERRMDSLLPAAA